MMEKPNIRTLSRPKPSRKGERETLPGGKTPGQGRRRLTPEVQSVLILLGLCLAVSILLFPDILTSPRVYKLGDIAERDIKATGEFLLEDEETTARHRQEALKAEPPVYDFDPIAGATAFNIKEAFTAGREGLERLSSNDQAIAPTGQEPTPGEGDRTLEMERLRERFFGILDVPPEQGVFDLLVTHAFPETVEKALIQILSRIFRQGIVGDKTLLMSHGPRGIILHDINSESESRVTDVERFYDLEGVKKVLRSDVGQFDLDPRLAEATIKLSEALARPNLTFNKRETSLRTDMARAAVKPIYFRVKEGEIIVREGERILLEHLRKLSELQKALKGKGLMGRVPGMAVLIGLLIAGMYVVGLMNLRTSRPGPKEVLFIAATAFSFFLLILAGHFVAEEVSRGFTSFRAKVLLFAIPLASGPMLVSVFHGMPAAAGFSLILSVLGTLAVGGSVEFFLYFFIGSLVALHGVKECRERGIFIRTGLTVGLVNTVMALAIEALHGSFYSLEVPMACAAAFVGGLLVGIITTGILPLVEMSFGYTTDIKLLELANLDQPLLRELMIQAPGTYHHSVIVSNMVEATAKSINANPLLAKVAAYYHDIGKMKKPIYFVENQMDGVNKHEKLAPSMSSLILISHVKEGVELAREHRLGKEITDIIRQHHGTSLISYFFQKAKDQAERKGVKSFQVKEEDFRYPGPKPQTKEAGLVMLADAVEAASRTLVDPTAARIQGMVQKIINKVFSDGQLDDCELTLRDLNQIAKSFYKTLSGIFHHRVDYPEPVDKTTPFRKGTNGSTDQFPAADAWPQKPEDPAKTGEGLRRLGLS
jgi:hypothetical protein